MNFQTSFNPSESLNRSGKHVWIACAAVFATMPLSFAAVGETANLKLWYAQEATNWMQEALPIGNGHMGAMIFGGVATERVQFNEESLWIGDEEDTGAYQNFGEYCVRFRGSLKISDPEHRATPEGQGVEATCDGNPQSKWCFEHQGHFPIIWQAELPKSQQQPVTSYTLTSGGDVPARDPLAWRFLGSQDGLHWSLLDERKDEPVWPARNTPRTYTFQNTATYTHYRFEFLATHQTPHFQISEISLGKNSQENTAKNYRRELDLNRAVHRVTFEQDGVHYTRESFASHPAKVIAMRFTADKPGSISADLVMTDAHGAKSMVSEDRITTVGAIPQHLYLDHKVWPALNYESQLRIIPQGGKLSTINNGIRVDGADGLVVLLDAGTDFLQDRSKNWRGPHPHAAIDTRLDAASKRGWDALLAEHLADYRKLFNRLELSLDAAPSTLPTDQRMAAYEISKPDLGLEELLFQYGRYLMIASSREGGLPANLQGKWNNSNTPPWRCDYHTDINIEMNYWLTGPANLSECFDPFTHWIDSIREVRKEATKKAFNARGWLMRGESGLFGGSTWDWTPGTSAWLLQNIYEHYRFTGDVDYLRRYAYPAMKEVSEYWLDCLIALPDGTLVTPESFSPEQLHVKERGISFEQQTVWDLFTNLIEASNILGVDAEFREEITAKRAKLLAPKIGKWGQLQEWMSDLDNPKDKHRHISHLFGVHPGRQISPNTSPALANAAKVSLTARGDDSTGWSTAWKISQWARLHDGDHAHKLFAYLIRPCGGTGMANEGGGLYSNLFDACPPFQIDGNFGFTAGICEMLLQSHMDEIHLLPAVPASWPSGKARGLVARGGVLIDLAWHEGKVTDFTLRSTMPHPVRVRINGELKTITPELIEK